MKFILPTGIGDSVWALHKIEAIRDALAPGELIDVYLIGGVHHIDSRAVDFVRRFKFVNKVDVRQFSIRLDPEIRADGTYNYLPDGRYTFVGEDYVLLIPNETLERGERLENWLPHYPIRWDIWQDFEITAKEREYGEAIAQRVGPFAVFYPGPLAGNTVDGHNRGPLWRPEDWVALGERVYHDLGLRIVAVGATYDEAYWYNILYPALKGKSWYWDSLVGLTNLGELWSVTSLARFVIGYQAGVGIISTYLGTPTGIFWRPHGNSINPERYLTFDERMASAWVPPKYIENGNHLPLIYGRHGVPYVMEQVARRGWAAPRPVGDPIVSTSP